MSDYLKGLPDSYDQWRTHSGEPREVEETETDEIPIAVSESVVELLGVKIRCYQLDDGRRIMNADDVEELLNIMAEGDK